MKTLISVWVKRPSVFVGVGVGGYFVFNSSGKWAFVPPESLLGTEGTGKLRERGFVRTQLQACRWGGGMARDDSMLGYISKCCSQQHRPGDHVMVMHSYISMNKSWNQLIRARSQIPLSAPLEAESLSRKAQACLRAREKNRRASEWDSPLNVVN